MTHNNDTVKFADCGHVLYSVWNHVTKQQGDMFGPILFQTLMCRNVIDTVCFDS